MLSHDTLHYATFQPALKAISIMMLPEEFEEYRLQREFFVDVILLTPDEAHLHVTSDSWHGLPSLFGKRMVEREGEWIIALGPENKAFLVQEALADNLQSKFVHFFLLYEGVEILSSYDGMCTLILDERFPSCKLLQEKYAVLLMQ
jgi:hypothetical protein